MSEKPEKRTKSGELPEVQAYRAEIESLRNQLLPELRERNDETEREVAAMKSMRPGEVCGVTIGDEGVFFQCTEPQGHPPPHRDSIRNATWNDPNDPK